MLAFSIDYYGIFFGATQSVELFCTYYSVIILNDYFVFINSLCHKVFSNIFCTALYLFLINYSAI